MSIVLRLQKGSVLSFQEMDNNFVNLDTRVQSLESSSGSSSGIPYEADTGNDLQWVEGTYDFGNNIIKYANVIQAESELANYSPATYHGMTMHVHETGALYFAHAGAWRKLLSDNADGDAANAGYVDSLSTVAYEGDLGALTDVVTQGVSDGDVLKYNANAGWFEPAPDLTADSGSGIELTNLSVNVGTAGTPDLTYDNTTGVFSYTPPDVGELSYAPDTGDDLQWVEGTYDFGNNIIKYANVIQAESELANYSPATYHGMTMHVHETGALYFAHGGVWRKLLTDNADGDAANAGYVDSLSTVAYEGDLGSLTDVVTQDVSDGDVLIYNATAGWFEPGTVSGGTASELNDLTDVVTQDVSDGDVLIYNATDGRFEPGTVSGGGIANIVEDTSPQLGGDLDVNGNSIQYTFNVGNDGASDYTFADSGNHWFPTTENDPVLYLRRGETYVFDVNASGHPFEIRVSNGGSAYNTGVTNNGTQVGLVTFKVPMSAPATLYYQCTAHSVMGNTINIV